MTDAITRMTFFLLQNDKKIVIEGDRYERKYKFCNGCKITRPISNFFHYHSGRLRNKCKFCTKMMQRKYRRKKMHTQQAKSL